MIPSAPKTLWLFEHPTSGFLPIFDQGLGSGESLADSLRGLGIRVLGPYHLDPSESSEHETREPEAGDTVEITAEGALFQRHGLIVRTATEPPFTGLYAIELYGRSGLVAFNRDEFTVIRPNPKAEVEPQADSRPGR